MRAAVISDVHANLPALRAVLGAIDEAEVDQVWCLGDMVGYGAEPRQCLELVRERSAVCLVGNHDLAVLGELDVATFSSPAAAAVEWTEDELDAGAMSFLRGLAPLGEAEGVGLYHASPRDPIWEYVLSFEQAEASLTTQPQRLALIGHSHVALFFARAAGAAPGDTQGAQAGDGALLDLADGSWLLNPGSVGQPRDGDPRAAWMTLDLGEMTARYHRVAYDVEAAADSIRAAGLPEQLADRLAAGH